MNTQAKAVAPAEALSPHIRQRVAFIAALIPDPDSANWSAIADTFDDLVQEVDGATLETSLGLLREPIRQKDARALGATIGTLLSSQPASASATNLSLTSD